MVVPISTYQGHAIVDTGRQSVGASAGTAALICLANTINAHARDPDRHADDRVATDARVARK